MEYKYKTKRYRKGKQFQYEYKKERHIQKPVPDEPDIVKFSADIDDAAADRVETEIDTSGDYHDIRKRLVQKYPKWSAYQRNQFAMKIVERKAFAETPKGLKEITIEKRTTLTGRGFGAKRQTMIRDNSGKYLGRPQNIKTYIRNGNVWGKNRLTGKSARLS